MKTLLITLSLLPLAACSSEYGKVETPQSSSAEATQAQKPYIAAAEQRLLELEADVAEIKQAVADKADDASEELDELLVALDEKREVAAQQLAALGEKTEDAWDSAGVRVEEVLDDLESAVAEAWDRIS